MFFIFGVKIKRVIKNISTMFKLNKFESIFVCREKCLKMLKENIEVLKGNAIKLSCYRADILWRVFYLKINFGGR
ncbi:hypothetical protein [Fusobacterium sp. MFO224]|uniref:hypothetical protein n=1 Tax=Fusobacterium sp. MFO224 TaxID=3378070 RepID=UPI0038526F22